MATEYTHPIFD